MASTTLALILPSAMTIFAMALLAASRFGMPAAFAWGAGIGLCAIGFATSVLPGAPHVAALVSGAFFALGFWFYAEAYLLHFAQPLRRRERSAIVAAYLVVNAHVVLSLDSLQLELLLNDVVTACLLGLALARVMNAARSLAERALVLTGSIIVIDTLIRVLAYVYFAGAGARFDDYGLSPYAFAMEITTSITGVFYVLSIAAALAERVFLRLRDAADRDPLTGLLNRRGFERKVAVITGDSALRGAVVIADIDHFKSINDAFGHAAGDAVIRVLGGELAAAYGEASICARFGGEEFVCFVPGAALSDAGVATQALRLRLSARDWRDAGIDRQITVSFGVVVVAEGESGIDRAIARADACLYAAKDAGRNQVVLEGGMFELKSEPDPEPGPVSNVIPLRRRSA